MRVFFRSAPVFMALSMALAGCSESDSPTGKGPAASSTKPAGDSTVATADPNATDVCLTVEGMT